MDGACRAVGVVTSRGVAEAVHEVALGGVAEDGSLDGVGSEAERGGDELEGIVIRQSPRRGAVRPGGTRVSLIVSSGRHK